VLQISARTRRLPSTVNAHATRATTRPCLTSDPNDTQAEGKVKPPAGGDTFEPEAILTKGGAAPVTMCWRKGINHLTGFQDRVQCVHIRDSLARRSDPCNDAGDGR
jgi:hypothetical protein